MEDERVQPETDALEVVPDDSADALADSRGDDLSNVLGSVAGSLSSLDGNMSEVRREVSEGLSSVDSRLVVLEKGQTLLGEQLNETVESEVREDENENRTYTVEIDGNQLSELRSHIQRTNEIGGVSLFLSLVCTLLVAALMGSVLWSAFSKGWRR